MDNNFFGKRALIVGSGVSGKGAAKALKQSGALIYFYDGTFPEADLIVLSPGVEPDEFEEYGRAKNIPVIGEIELGFRFETAPVVAITGTNGKTTTTMLTGEILKKSGFDAIVCGNIGASYAESVLAPHNRTVAEVSSFQLLTVKDFRPRVAVITNITPDHLDRHGDMDNYIAAKLRICENQTSDDYLITTPQVKKYLGGGVRSNVLTLGSELSAENGELVVLGKKIADASKLNLRGEHNVCDALFACAAAMLTGATESAAHDALMSFRPAPHRLCFVGKYNGKNYFNDSKGTNIGAAIAAANSMEGDTALIAGGSDKGYEFDELFSSLPRTVKYVVGMGEVREKLKAAAERTGFDGFILAMGLEDAVQIATRLDVENVLLSPAAASFDAYEGYDKRGEHFERLIRA